ncbi:MAG: YdeI/OmpD-associated family protein [Bacteroidota bacterium]
MIKKDKRVDTYIFNAAPFAQEILMHFRALVHKACPEVEETVKWSMPFFDYKGEMLCNMAAFKKHCAIGFWKAAFMKDAKKLKDGNQEAMGHYGRITSVKDLPDNKTIIANIKEAMKLNDDGIKMPAKKKAAVKEPDVPEELMKALSKNKKARTFFDSFPPSQRREYILWITEAKSEATRIKRLETAMEWITEGKHRHWKYQK